MLKVDYYSGKLPYFVSGEIPSEVHMLFPVEELPEELIGEIASRLDYSTIECLALTSRKIRQLLPGHFNPIHFFAIAAKLGHVKQINYSVDLGGPFFLPNGEEEGHFFIEAYEKKKKNFQ